MINFRFYGEKPCKAAVIHGGPGAPGSVAVIARGLSMDMGVIEPLQTKTTIEDLLDELREVIRINCMVPITLVGHSWARGLSFSMRLNIQSLQIKSSLWEAAR